MTHVLKSNGDSIFFYLPLYDKEENLGKALETRVTEIVRKWTNSVT